MIFFSGVKVLQMTLPDALMSTIEILKFVNVTNCYTTVYIAYLIFFNDIIACDCSVYKEVFKIEIIENIFEIINVIGKIE